MSTNTTAPNIIDINFGATQKQKIRVDGDDNRILELNTSDFGVITRLRDTYPKLKSLTAKAHKFSDIAESDDDTEEAMEAGIKNTADLLQSIDEEMRDYLDKIFDSNVSEICAPSGTMYDPFNGKFRFEYIIEVLISLYEENITKEYKLMENRVSKHTSKYIAGK